MRALRTGSLSRFPGDSCLSPTRWKLFEHWLGIATALVSNQKTAKLPFLCWNQWDFSLAFKISAHKNVESSHSCFLGWRWYFTSKAKIKCPLVEARKFLLHASGLMLCPTNPSWHSGFSRLLQASAALCWRAFSRQRRVVSSNNKQIGNSGKLMSKGRALYQW